MALELTEIDFFDLLTQAHEQEGKIYQPLDLGHQVQVPQRIGQGKDCILELRGGLEIDVRNVQLHQPLALSRHHNDCFPITAKFYLSGGSRIKTPQVPGIAADYEEIAGYNYLYHLPDLTETEEWPSDQPIQMVMVSASMDYFRGLTLTGDSLPRPLQQRLQETQRFHQSLGKITPAMTQVLQQILNCPYRGSAQQLYLESKAMELFSLQVAQLETDSAAPKPIKLKPSDIERVQYAQAILEQHLCDPPTLLELARQVGLNDCTLKRGFRQLLGTTVFGYLRNCRMQQAQTLLLQSPHLTIAQVAAQVGYRNPEAFSTAFKRQFDISPKAYQLRHLR